MDFYVPDPLLLFVAEGYYPTPARLAELLLEELGIGVVDDPT